VSVSLGVKLSEREANPRVPSAEC